MYIYLYIDVAMIILALVELLKITLIIIEKCKEYIKLDRDKSTFKSHRDFSSEKEISFKHF